MRERLGLKIKKQNDLFHLFCSFLSVCMPINIRTAVLILNGYYMVCTEPRSKPVIINKRIAFRNACQDNKMILVSRTLSKMSGLNSERDEIILLTYGIPRSGFIT